MRLIRAARLLARSDTSKDSFYGITGQAVAAIAGAVFFAAAARLVSLEEFGLLSLAIATAAIIKDVIDPSLNSALIKFISHSKTSAKQITRYVFKIKLIYFSLILGLGFLIPGILSQIIFRQNLPFLMLLTLVTSATMSISAMISGFLQGHKMFLKDSAFVAAQPVVRLLLLMVIMYFGWTSLTALVVVNIGGYLFVTAFFASIITAEFLMGDIPQSMRQSTNQFIGPLTISTITGTLTDRVGLFITNYLLGPAQVGLLAAVLRLFIPAKQIAGVLNAVFGSRFARFITNKQADTYLRKSLFMMIPLGLTAMVGSLFAPLILQLMYGQAYVHAAVILQLITLGFVAFLIQVPFVAKLVFYKGRTDVVVWISIVQFILTMGLNWWLIGQLEILGAAIAMMATMISVAVIYGWVTQTVDSKI